METHLKPLPVLAFAFGLAACQPVPPAGTASAPPVGEALASARCGTCHAIGRQGLSPNPNAPPFAAIVNQPGLTDATLSTWLRDAHNYPQDMDFTLGEGEVDALIAHMLMLRDPDYRPPS